MATLRTRTGNTILSHAELDANFKRTVTQKTTTYQILISDNRSVIEGNHASTPFTITLPPVATADNSQTGDFEITVTNINAAVVTVDGSGAETIDGSTTLALQQWASATFILDSAQTGWKSAAKSNTELNVKNYGALGDGSTDDTAAIILGLAAAGGRTLLFPSGTYVVAVDTTVMFTPEATTRIQGEAGTVLRFNMTDTATYSLFDLANAEVTFSDIKIELNTSVTGGTVVVFQWQANGLYLHNVEVDGGVTTDISGSHVFQVINCSSSGTFGRLAIDNCYWHDVTRMWLRANASTAVVTDIRVSSSHFVNSESTMFAMNAPLGSITNVAFTGNTWRDPFINAVQTDSFFIGPQAHNVTITGNSFYGTSNECIHVEENAKNVVISGNSIKMNSTERCVSVLDAANSGGTIIPENIIITNNVIERIDGTNVGSGIELVNDASGFEPVNRCVISGNVIKGWEYGIVNGANQDDSIQITDNIIDDCTAGVRSQYGEPDVKNNQLTNCTTGLTTISGGGAFGKNSFYNCTTIASAPTGEVSLLGAGFKFDRTDFTGSGNTDFALFAIASTDRCYGLLSSHAYGNSSHEDYSMDEVTWDGTTLTVTNKIVTGGGHLTISVIDSSSVLTLRVANASTVKSDASVYIDFAGMIAIP